MRPKEATKGARVMRQMSDGTRTDYGFVEGVDDDGVYVRWDNGAVALYHWGESMLPRASRLEIAQ